MLFLSSGWVLAGMHSVARQAVSVFCNTARWQPTASEVALE